MKVTRIATLALALSLMGNAAVAQVTREVTFQGATQVGGSYVTLDGAVVGPYWASSPGLGTFNIYCVDRYHSVWNGRTWNAWFTPISSSAVFTHTRLGAAGVSSPDAQVRYQRAAWMASKFASNPTAADWKGLHGQIWKETSGYTPPAGWSDNGWLAQLDAAQTAGFAGMNFDYWQVVTPTNFRETGSAQEMLAYVTPEPGTILLLASGLVALAGAAVVTRRVV